MENQDNEYEYLEELEEFIANMMKKEEEEKEEEAFVEVAYEIVCSSYPAYNIDDTIDAATGVAETLSDLYKNAKSDKEKTFIQKIIGFLALEPEIHMGEYFEERDNNYLSGYTTPLDIEKLLKRGEDIIKGDDSFPLIVSYYDGNEIDEERYIKILGMGKEEIEFVEISWDDFIEERWHEQKHLKEDIANMMEKEEKDEKAFVEVANKILYTGNDIDDAINDFKKVAEILSDLYKNAKSEKEKNFIQKLIGFLALGPGIHAGNFDKERGYVSGYTAPLDIEKLLKRGEDIIKGDDTFPLSISYSLIGDKIDEQKYFEILGIGKGEIEFVEISKEDFIEERSHDEKEITPEKALENALRVTSADEVDLASREEKLELNPRSDRGEK